MLEIKNITKTYEGKLLLHNISFSVANGETICLLGPSGSGKSTLLRIIAGLESAEEGTITWNGENIANMPVHKRNFGLMFQDYALFPHKSVFDNVAFGLQMQKRPKPEIAMRVKSALEKVRMTGFENRRVTDLSGGEQQRVALARTLAPNPRLVMFDEPLGALDRALRERLVIELRGILAEANIPAIYVTHDQQEAFAIASRVLLLHETQIVQSGTPEEICAHPADDWVRDFLGQTPLPIQQTGSTNRTIKIIKRDFAGEERWHYEGKRIHENGEKIVIEAFFNKDDMPFMDTVLKNGDRFIETYYYDRWYNIFEIYDRDDNKLKGWYCNIGTPAKRENDHVLSYKDLALDLWVTPDGVQTTLDEDEFAKLNLDEDSRQRALDALQELKQKFTSQFSLLP